MMSLSAPDSISLFLQFILCRMISITIFVSKSVFSWSESLRFLIGNRLRNFDIHAMTRKLLRRVPKVSGEDELACY